ncbi:T9SS type B sorting domain-containing protein [Lutibacter citreus]|uniref:T9SS type B sorting domain-containing protein n=1 Tax=Lutibacter citreus TaxID=2138210 RepID=UPI000DBE1642|nr:T9SS type B sorting domain-containing protein [Lutibacter citreus]
MKKGLLLITLFTFLNSFSQGEANIWYFGEKAGLNFNSGKPVSITNSELSTREGCSSFSDSKGNLLFYSDGTTVWNKNHIPMPNGRNLKGGSSSSQSAMIIPKPKSSTLYYLFTVGSLANENPGFNYYTIDMTKDSGNGDIVQGPIDLNEGREFEWSEKIAAINGKECETFWVISYVSNEFKAFKITKDGVAVNSISTMVDFIANDRRGYLKISPNGKKIAIAHMNDKTLVLYDFNNSTGVVSNPQYFEFPQPADSPYGIEFSGSGDKLYVHTSNDFFSQEEHIWNNPENHKSALYQFDLTFTNAFQISNSRVQIDSQNLYRGALQLGPDQKIYRALSSSYNNGTNYLGVIEYPENNGLECSYKHNEINLGLKKSTQGLPPFIASIFYQIEILNASKNDEIVTNKKIKLCVGSNYTFNTESLSGTPTYEWKLNDSIISHKSNLSIKNIQKSSEGFYQLEAHIVNDCGKKIIYKGKFNVAVFDPPIIPTKIIYNQCDIDTDSFDGITQFNLENKIPDIINNNPNLEVTFYKSESDYENEKPIETPSNYISSTTNNLLFKVSNLQSECSSIGKMELNVSPTSLENYNTIYVCENDNGLATKHSQSSGVGSFNFELKRNEIKDLFNTSDISVEFYETSKDAQLQQHPISGTKEYANREIFVNFSNKNSCISIGKFNLVVNKIPTPNFIEEDVILCVGSIDDNPSQEYFIALDGDSHVNTDTYKWYFNEEPIFEATKPIYYANKEGNYRVEVTRTFKNDITNNHDTTQCEGFSIFNVIESNNPVLYPKFITIIDDSSNNSITIDKDKLGIGNYHFSLDDLYGEYQDEPVFENVSTGFHTIYIEDKYGCGFDQSTVSIVGFPNFFTPNNDGINDYWRISGVNSNFYPSSNIHIFNRYGKIITILNPDSYGWNGTFNGKQLPSSDYWYSVELTDKLGNKRYKKGHFSLIRR